MEEKSFRLRRRSPKYTMLDEDNISEISWPSRPSTQDGLMSVSSASRLSSDSGASSIEDFNRRSSSPLPTTFLDYWDGVRRHTAPPRKTSLAQTLDYDRPNTVHAWDVYPSRNTLSRYMPLPAIGVKTPDDCFDNSTRPRKYCFQEVNDTEDDADQVDNDDRRNFGYQEVVDGVDESPRPHTAVGMDSMVFRRPDHLNVPKLCSGLSSMELESEADSDFDEESGVVCPTDDEDDDEAESQRRRRPIVRSATFTIEDKKKEAELQQQQQQERQRQQTTTTTSNRLLLAVRLPDGSRVSGYFDGLDSLQRVCALALEQLENPLAHYELVTTGVPKKTFSDFSMTLDEAGIVDKTLLNLQPCDDDDDDDSA